MGLDMYLDKSKYVMNWSHNPRKNVVTLNGVEIQNCKRIVVEAMY